MSEETLPAEMSEDYMVLLPESMEILRKKLTLPGYTDKQLHRTASFFVASTMALGAALGAADDSPLAIMSTANVAARTVLADFINTGCINVSAIDRFMDRAEIIYAEALAKERANAEPATDDDA